MSRRSRPLAVETFRAHAAEDVLKSALSELGWKNVRVSTAASASSAVCDIYWRGIGRDDPPIPEGSYIARIPGMSTVAHKAELAKHMNRLRKFFPEEFDFYPCTWLLPEEQEEFEAYTRRKREQGKAMTYILKPDEGAQGEGIFLFQNPRDLCALKVPSVVQEYISKPLLIRGLKFDLRLYVLVVGLDPPEVYLSTSGMVRFCTIPYQPPSVKNLHQTFMHLTNYSLNKRSKDYVHSEEEEGGGQEGSKRTLTSVWAELIAQGCDMDEMWGKVGKLVGKTVVAVLPQLMVEQKTFILENSLKQSPKGFQLLGFDILMDKHLCPHLLEVNAYPSLRVDYEQLVRPGVVEYLPSPVDLAIKLPIVKDTLRTIARRVRGVDGLPEGSCFGELLPCGLGDLAHLRVFERCAQLYLQFVGVRGGVKMGPSAFRTFTRQCGVCNAQFTNADVDILYIDACRRHGNTLERNALSLHGFCHALLSIAQRLYGDVPSLSSLTQLLEKCEEAVARQKRKQA